VKIPVGSKVKFASDRSRYTVQASSARYAVCTRLFNLRHTVFYTIIDFREKVRGTENVIFCAGAETREQCEDMLCRLMGKPDSGDRSLIAAGHPVEPAHTEVSHRNRIPLDIEKITPPSKRS
jgi:hypothetical protein